MLDYGHSRLNGLAPVRGIETRAIFPLKAVLSPLNGLAPACGIEGQKDTQDIGSLLSVIPEYFVFKRVGFYYQLCCKRGSELDPSFLHIFARTLDQPL
jgi:hypothetical protein